MSVGCGMSTYRTYSSTGEESAARVGGSSGDDGDSDYAGPLYEALASAETLRLDPAAFHAFMCSFFNDAQEARRTAGYRTLRAWQDCLFSSGRAFTFTSNVDGMHLREGFARVFECHGSKMRWQCSKPCRDEVWDLLLYPSFRFPSARPAKRRRLQEQDEAPSAEDSGAAAEGAAAEGGGLTEAVSENSPSSAAASAARFVGQFDVGDATPPAPSCPHCGSAARPAVLLFGEDYASRHEAGGQAEEWAAWKQRVLDALAADRSKRLVVIEIGAGTAVPSVRDAGESLLRRAGSRQCTLVRINPTPMLGDNTTDGVLSIKWGAEAAIAHINECVRKLARESVD
mmetsp:Transcript_12623/g.41122  ORF Transcript_12623/g.41122 Transcript_12623/m.41122 type:complete len:342 (+) Transcript_12623:214-1239(+)